MSTTSDKTAITANCEARVTELGRPGIPELRAIGRHRRYFVRRNCVFRGAHDATRSRRGGTP